MAIPRREASVLGAFVAFPASPALSRRDVAQHLGHYGYIKVKKLGNWKRSVAGAFQPLPSFFQMCMRDSASTTAWYNSSICTFKEMSVSEAQAELLNMTEQFPQAYMHETSAPHSECSTIRAIGVVSAVLPSPRAVEQATGCTAGYWLRRRRRIPVNIIAAATEVAMTAMVAIMRRRWGRGPPRPRASWTEVNHEPS